MNQTDDKLTTIRQSAEDAYRKAVVALSIDQMPLGSLADCLVLTGRTIHDLQNDVELVRQRGVPKFQVLGGPSTVATTGAV